MIDGQTILFLEAVRALGKPRDDGSAERSESGVESAVFVEGMGLPELRFDGIKDGVLAFLVVGQQHCLSDMLGVEVVGYLGPAEFVGGFDIDGRWDELQREGCAHGMVLLCDGDKRTEIG